jgi:CTP:molybdopterin cytidylyltransferase MocA
MPVSAIINAADRAAWDTIALAMLPWGDDLTLIEYHIAQLRDAGVGDIEVVLGYDAARAIGLVTGENVEPIVNATWETDVASTWRTGAAALVRGTPSAIVIDVAAPRPVSVLQTLIDAHEHGGREITAAAYEGTRGTPIVMGERALAALRNLRGDQDIDAVIARFVDAMQDVAFDNEIVLRRIDSRAAYDELRALLA